jgi:hypothetical protein
MTIFLAGILVLTGLGQWNQCQGNPVSRRYFNYAQGFSVAIPKGLRGRRGQSAGPERGVSIPLSRDCAGVVVVYGEPNSLEWPSPAAAISDEAESAITDDPRAEVRRYITRLGRLRAAGVKVSRRATSEVEETVVAFRPGGGPTYTARLRTTVARYERDREVFRAVLRGFRIEAWR